MQTEAIVVRLTPMCAVQTRTWQIPSNTPEFYWKTGNFLTTCYQKATFFVKMDGRKSELKRQQTGIRQGCPASPYLFIISMSVLFRDMHEDDCLKLTRQGVRGTQADQVLYADDTICIAQNERAMNRLLGAIEEEGSKYGMRLNRDKCEVLGFGKINAIKFRDGTKVSQKKQVKYLGCLLNEKGNPNDELVKRIGECTGTLDKLHVFFRHGNCSARVKLTVYDAVIRSKLMYGLETVALNKTSLKKLDAFQMKGLRRITGHQSTFVDRTATNAKVIEAVNQSLRGTRRKGVQVKKLSEFHQERRVTMLAKVIAAGAQDPVTTATMNPDTLQTPDHGRRRWGHPRVNWLQETMQDMWTGMRLAQPELRHAILDLNLQMHRDKIREEAVRLMAQQDKKRNTSVYTYIYIYIHIDIYICIYDICIYTHIYI